MFNNLIESSSHRKELQRRGSFIIFTTATYVLLFSITAVASIYAYDANLGEQSTEITWLPAVSLTPTEVNPPNTTLRPHQSNNNQSSVAERQIAMLSVAHPDVVPDGVSVTPNKNLPLPPSGIVRFTGRDRDPFSGGSSGPAIDGSRIGRATGPILVDAGDPPPPPTPAPVNRVIRVSRVLNSQAISLPKPVYPVIARQAHVQGTVSVQVLIDENGRVVSAKAVAGNPLLVIEAQRAAMQARFSPTIVGDQPMKVSGVITYNFVMQ